MGGSVDFAAVPPHGPRDGGKEAVPCPQPATSRDVLSPPPREPRRPRLVLPRLRRAYSRKWLALHRAAYNAALRAYYADHAAAMRAYNRERVEARRAYHREYARRRRGLMRAGTWKPRASYPRI